MTRLISGLILIFAGMLAATSASAQEERPSCDWENSQEVSIAELTANFRDWTGRCVRLRGIHTIGYYSTENLLLADRMAMLENSESRQMALNVERPDEAPHAPPHASHSPQWEEIVGRFSSCTLAYEQIRRLQAERPNSIIMASGLCHGTVNHYLIPTAHRVVEAAPVMRLLWGEVDPSQRELAIVPESAREWAARRTVAERMIAALETQNFDAFLTLVRPDLAGALERLSEEEFESQYHPQHLSDARAEFTFSLDSYARSQAVSGARHVMLTDAHSQTDTYYWCRMADGVADALLPVREYDIDNTPVRPYFCIKTGRYAIFDQGPAPSAHVPMGTRGFGEPLQ